MSDCTGPSGGACPCADDVRSLSKNPCVMCPAARLRNDEREVRSSMDADVRSMDPRLIVNK